MALSPREMHDRIIGNLKAKTGHAFDFWHEVVTDECGDRNDKDLVAHLKGAHGLGHYTAVAIIKEAASGNEYEAADDLVAALFEGKPEAQRLFEAIDAKVTKLPRTERVPCKTYVGYRAKTQFMIVAPSGEHGLRCGLALSPDDPCLLPSSSFGSARIKSHFEVGEGGPTTEQLALIKTAHGQNA
ncbi:MAG: DUF5655 domain-containing protein [Pseudomonadota bacterium]